MPRAQIPSMTTFSHMPFDSSIVLRDPLPHAEIYTSPFSSKSDQLDPLSWDPRSHPALAQPPTPPLDMNDVQTSSPLEYYPQEHGYYLGNYVPVQHNRRSVLASSSFAESRATALQSEMISHRSPPVRPLAHDKVTQSDMSSHRRQGSHTSSTSTRSTVCASVNYSGENIHELAAQITCLFWFESIDILQSIEDSTIAPAPKLLTPDVRPTPEFQKWVNHVLSTTRVADNVILLALLFIHRLKKQNPKVRGKPGSEYRLLTVALMLGNKFLDDNTYTNKTWAEVSFISVNEVHIMEVEFLSNMKYCLFTSAEDWLRWQTLLGKFVSFYNRANRPPTLPAPILPPNSSLQLPRPLPSPPASTNASPPYSASDAPAPTTQFPGVLHGPTPAPSPLVFPGEKARHPGQSCSRKRSLDDRSHEPPSKRISACYPQYTSPHRNTNQATHFSNVAPAPRLTLPTPPAPISNTSAIGGIASVSSAQQLPPLNVPTRAMAMIYPNASNSGQVQSLPAMAGHPAQAPAIHPSQQQARNHSPYASSALPSPTTSLPPSATSMYPSIQLSPSYLLQQRSSPYRPVHRVSTLLYPPPTAAIQARPGEIELSQMQYQPLGKPVQHTGRLPYLAQNQWLDGTHPHDMTPIHQWPGFTNGTPALMPQKQQHLGK